MKKNIYPEQTKGPAALYAFIYKAQSIAFFIVFLAFLLALSSTALQAQTASDVTVCNSITNQVYQALDDQDNPSHSIYYAGYEYDYTECKTYFYYCVNDEDNVQNGISHITLGIEAACENSCLDDPSKREFGFWEFSGGSITRAAAPERGEFGTGPQEGEVEYGDDPQTTVCGVKYGYTLGDQASTEPLKIYITLPGLLPDPLGNPQDPLNPAYTMDVAFKYGNLDDVVAIPGPGDPETCECVNNDYGDLPDLADGTATGDYETALANGGPSHIITPGIMIGAAIDAEVDGQPSTPADGDDTDTEGDDEDGVDFTGLNFKPGQTISIPVVVTNTGLGAATLYAFVDWNNDGDFDDTGETVTVPITDQAGSQTVLATFTIPAGAKPFDTVGARFRLTTDALAAPAWEGAATNGEVEDYILTISCPSGNCVDVNINKSNN